MNNKKYKDDLKVTEIIKNTDGINAKSHRKEGNPIDCYKLLAYRNKEFIEVVDLRVYFPKNQGSTVSACVWIGANTKTHYFHNSGSASVGGWGYHKPSSAAAQAFHNAGLRFSSSVDYGETAITDALLAIGEKLRFKNMTVIRTYG